MNSNDRELLELAAKAAGYEFLGEAKHGAYLAGEVDPWRPLVDDGDALRLAVALNLHVEIDFDQEPPEVRIYGGWRFEIGGISEAATGDPYAATRRAIVRAAAEIGRSERSSPRQGMPVPGRFSR